VAPRSSAAAAGFFLNSASIFQICDTAMGMAAIDTAAYVRSAATI
jgi:hypothetical protein